MRRLALFALCLLLAACGRLGSNEGPVKDVSGWLPDLRFEMQDENGKVVTDRDFRGAPVLLYFGFTHCPDVCPTTLAQLVRAADQRPGAHARILFVTVDPARDTTAHLAEYVHAFGPQVAGLRGSARQLEELARRYRVGYSLGKPDARGEYDVMHSSGVFGFDGDGRARVLILASAPNGDVEAALDRLSAGNSGRGG